MSYNFKHRFTAEVVDQVFDWILDEIAEAGYLAPTRRSALAKQVEGLYDVCKMTGISSSHSSDCLYALNISPLSPWSDSFRDERAIDRAISIINRQSCIGHVKWPCRPITVPVLSLVGGIVGSIGVSRLAEYVVDITYVE